MAKTSQAARSAEESTGAEGGTVEGKVIAVRSAAATGRRRAGFAFGPEPTELLVSDLTEEQLEQIVNDPLLSVSFR